MTEVEPKRIGYISMMERKEEDGSLTGTNPFEQMDFCWQSNVSTF